MPRRVTSCLVLVLTLLLPSPRRGTATLVSPDALVVTPAITVLPGTRVALSLQLLAPVKRAVPINVWVRLVDDRPTNHIFSLRLGCQRLCLSAAGGAVATAADVIVRDIPTETFTPAGRAHTISIDERSECIGLSLRDLKQFDLSFPTVIAANPTMSGYVARRGTYMLRLRLYARLGHGDYVGLVRVRPLVRVERFNEVCTSPHTSQQ